MTAEVATIGPSRVHMDVAPGERLVFPGTGVEIELVHKSGRAARLVVVTPRAQRIVREASDDGGRSKHAIVPLTDRG